MRLLVVAALACGLFLAAALEAQAAIHVSAISRTSAGVPANGYSTTEGNGGMLSGDGKIAAFESNAANLPAGDGSTFRCYVRNIATGKTRIVSVTSNGVPASSQTFSPAVSADGRYVAFDGTGMGLPGANGAGQVWEHDLKTGKTFLVSKANQGPPSAGGAYPSVSGDGRFVAFESSASNLPGGDGVHDFVYAHDRVTGKTILVSRDNQGHPAFGQVYGQLLSADGRYVVYYSNDADLPAGNGTLFHVYVFDRKTGLTRVVDRNSTGAVANGSSYEPSISAGGRFVAFDSHAANLPGGNVGSQSYLRDLKTGKTKLVSQNSSGAAQTESSLYPHVSADGRYVTFYADGSNLPGGDGLTDQIYLRDVQQGKTILISKTANGTRGNDYSEYPSISADGHWIEFYGNATNLGGNPNNQNVFRAGPIG